MAKMAGNEFASQANLGMPRLLTRFDRVRIVGCAGMRTNYSIVNLSGL